MPRQLHLEGPALEPLLEQARADHGPAVTVVGAHRVRRGGFAGFFAREHYEVTVEVPDVVAGDPVPVAVPAAPPSTAAAAASGAAGLPTPRAATLEQLLALADRGDHAASTAPAAAPAAAPASAPAAAPASVQTGTPVTRSAAQATSPTARPSGERLPGRALSTESRSFDEVLAALRADLLGPGSTDDLDRHDRGAGTEVLDLAGPPDAPSEDTWTPAVHDLVPHQAPPSPGTPPAARRAAATPWQPATVIDEPDPGLPTVVPSLGVVPVEVAPLVVAPVEVAPVTVVPVSVPGRPAASVPAVEPTAAEPVAGPIAGPVAETVPEPVAEAVVTTEPTPAPHPLTAELVDLAVAVGADRTVASAAAADVEASGVRTLRHALPLLAAALADPLTESAAAAADGTAGTDAAEAADDDGVPGDPARRLLAARAGDVVVVLGPPGRVDAAAAHVAAQLGTMVLARWSDEPAGRRGAGPVPVVREVGAVPLLAGRARAAELPAVLAVPDASLGEGVPAAAAGKGRAALLRSLRADQLVLVAEADASPRRQTTVAGRVGAAHGARRPLVLALVGCDAAAAPLGHAPRPVALLDGRPATGGAWTGVVLDALRAAAAR